MQREIYTPPSGPPSGPIFQKGFIEKVQETEVRNLVEIFYNNILQSEIRTMFPETIEESIEKSADFMVQVMGGRPYYSEKYGHPRMRARHFPFEIDEKARRIWLGCYKKALESSNIGKEEREIIWEFLTNFSAWMVNKK